MSAFHETELAAMVARRRRTRWRGRSICGTRMRRLKLESEGRNLLDTWLPSNYLRVVEVDEGSVGVTIICCGEQVAE